MWPRHPNAYRLSSQRVIGVEGADAVLEFAFDRRIEVAGRIASVEPPNGSLPASRIVRSQANSANLAARHLEYVVSHVGPTVHELARSQGSFEFHPLMTVGGTFVQLTMMNLPPADEEIEIVQAAQIAVFHGVRHALRSVRRNPPELRRPLTLALCGSAETVL